MEKNKWPVLLGALACALAGGWAASSSAGPAPARKGPPSLACGNLREQRNAIEGRLRVGGRTETVQMYQRQLRGVETNLAEGNC